MRDDRVLLWPTDVFDHDARWQETSREEALSARDVDRVVVVFRFGPAETAT